ncbi:uncharacterized protein LOC123535591 [Mercenaria mercenaria]|uniref:uncharacterized protein LOC123535591 n=1 Tax=Mercenaria mercenaria TaxID=6596 RepID=UPI00234E3F5C|nr:uncharacterized protein LOC123535591 [Mercenaria mercenaria]
MAVSDRKVSDFRGSVSKGSAEDFDHSCEPCLAIGQHVEAHGFCVDCQEYMCKNCSAYHQRIKATKHHNLLNIDSMGKHTIHSTDSAVCTEKCHIHKNEFMKFFCTNHEFLGCTDCITLNHRTCKIDYIPDKCAGIGDSDEYRELMTELDRKMKHMDAMLEKATLQDKEVDSSYDHIIKEITKFRKEINDRLDQLQKQIETEADKKKFTEKQTVKKVIETCTAASSDIMKFKSNLQDSKTSQQNGQLYIRIKQAKFRLKSYDLKNAQESLDKTSIQYTFERNKELENLLTKLDIFGKLTLPTTLVKKKQLNLSTTMVKNVHLSLSTPLVTPRKKKVFDTLTHRGDINVKTKSDKNECGITGYTVLSSNKVILADNNNNKLKVVDTYSKAVIEEKELDSEPYDIAVLPQDKIAVTMPEKEEILIMKTNGKLSISRRIPMKKCCNGITYHQGQFYVVCWHPYSVHLVDTHGNVNSKISLNSEIFSSPNYILLSEDARHIYISNYTSHNVSCVTLHGDISAVYKHNDLYGPVGMAMLDDGSLLVCCYNNNTIHHISGDLKQGQTIIGGLQKPQTICYNQQQQEVYIGGDSDQLKIMK